MLNLYKIADEYLFILHNLENVPDEDLEQKLDEMNKHYDNFEQTAVNMAAYIKNLNAEEDVIRATIKDYDDRADALEKRAERLKKFLKDMMDRLGIEKVINDPLHKLNIRTNPPSVKVIDLDLIPEEEFSKKELKYLDKIRLKEQLQAGRLIPGCELVRQTRLDIK